MLTRADQIAETREALGVTRRQYDHHKGESERHMQKADAAWALWRGLRVRLDGLEGVVEAT